MRELRSDFRLLLIQTPLVYRMFAGVRPAISSPASLLSRQKINSPPVSNNLYAFYDIFLTYFTPFYAVLAAGAAEAEGWVFQFCID